jgi:hypothetical protein
MPKQDAEPKPPDPRAPESRSSGVAARPKDIRVINLGEAIRSLQKEEKQMQCGQCPVLNLGSEFLNVFLVVESIWGKVAFHDPFQHRFFKGFQTICHRQ